MTGRKYRAAKTRRQARTASAARKLRDLPGELDNRIAELRHETKLDRAGISRRLADSRERSGRTQREMAAALRVGLRSLQYWEAPHDPNVPFHHLDRWAELTGAAKGWLLTGDEPRVEERLVGIEREIRRVSAELAELQAVLPVLERLEAALDRALAELAQIPGRGASV